MKGALKIYTPEAFLSRRFPSSHYIVEDGIYAVGNVDV